MRHIKFLAFAIMLFSSFFITSCSSSDDSPEVDNGVSTGDYWPLALNNEWNYTDGVNLTEQKVIGTDTFGGDLYYKFEAEELALFGIDVNYWVAKKGGTYYQKVGEIVISEDGFTMKIKSYELAVFKDYLDVNETWKNSNSINVTVIVDGEKPVDFKMNIKSTGKILERDGTITVNDQVYNDVIKMSLTQVFSLEGETGTAESIYWYAKDVGPVKFSNTIDGDTTISELISYSLNN